MDEILNPEGLADQFESPETEQKDKVIIKAIGVGGGGGNAVNYMFRQGIKHVSFVVLNTDRQALRQSPVPTKVMIGDGLGAGDRPFSRTTPAWCSSLPAWEEAQAQAQAPSWPAWRVRRDCLP